MSQHKLFTVGHSTLEIKQFLDLLTDNGITMVGDVRSMPYSKYTPQFNREKLEVSLRKQNIGYIYLGKELGGRNDDCIEGGKVSYEKLANTKLFQDGLRRIHEQYCKHDGEKYLMALMCSEKDPIDCHRTILVSRHLKNRYAIEHIKNGEKNETHYDAINGMIDWLKETKPKIFANKDMFEEKSDEDIAYEEQGRKISYKITEKHSQTKQH